MEELVSFYVKNYKTLENLFYNQFYEDYLVKLDPSFEYKINDEYDAIDSWKSCLSPYNCEHSSSVIRNEVSIHYGLLSFYLFYMGYSVVGYPRVLQNWKSARQTSIEVFKEPTRKKYNIGSRNVPWVKRKEFIDELELKKDETKIIKIDKVATEKLKLIGEGSYAFVHSYFDPFYDTKFAIKTAKKNLDEKEILRFKNEFESMKSLSSPYILEVYKYDNENNRYSMELLDCSLDKYIQKNFSKLNLNKKKSIIFQIIKALHYIHSNELLHRDISVNNFLLKEYKDGTVIIKVSDFGLVKSREHFLTSLTSEIKGHLNVSDSILQANGFSNYSIINETFALTRIIYFVLTGRINYDNIKDENIKNFVAKGTNPIAKERFQSIEELNKSVIDLFILLEKYFH